MAISFFSLLSYLRYFFRRTKSHVLPYFLDTVLALSNWPCYNTSMKIDSFWSLNSLLHVHVFLLVSLKLACLPYLIFCQTSNIGCTKFQNLNVSHLVLQLSLPNPLKPGVESRMTRCSWSSADRRCSNYISAINNFIAYYGAAYIRGWTAYIS